MGESLSNYLREVYLQGTWIANTNLKNELSQTTFLQAVKEESGLNSIAALTFHLSYYLEGLLPAFQDMPLTIHDEHSFTFHLSTSTIEWNTQVNHLLQLAETCDILIKSLTLAKLNVPFDNANY